MKRYISGLAIFSMFFAICGPAAANIAVMPDHIEGKAGDLVSLTVTSDSKIDSISVYAIPSEVGLGVKRISDPGLIPLPVLLAHPLSIPKEGVSGQIAESNKPSLTRGTIRITNLFIPPSHIHSEYYLEGDDGRRIAFLTATKTVPLQSFKDNLGKKVYVYSCKPVQHNYSCGVYNYGDYIYADHLYLLTGVLSLEYPKYFYGYLKLNGSELDFVEIDPAQPYYTPTLNIVGSIEDFDPVFAGILRNNIGKKIEIYGAKEAYQSSGGQQSMVILDVGERPSTKAVIGLLEDMVGLLVVVRSNTIGGLNGGISSYNEVFVELPVKINPSKEAEELKSRIAYIEQYELKNMKEALKGHDIKLNTLRSNLRALERLLREKVDYLSKEIKKIWDAIRNRQPIAPIKPPPSKRIIGKF